LFGKEIPIQAEVVQLQSFSGHADADEILTWMGHASRAPAMTYLTHGEPNASDTLRGRINHELSWQARVPEHLERIELGAPK
jgi:metallo-beta-lactamase family protein